MSAYVSLACHAARLRVAEMLVDEAPEETDVGRMGVHPAVAEIVSPLGFRPEPRAYRPHVTLGPSRDASVVPGFLAQSLPERTVPIEHVTLSTSELEPGGPVYDVVERFGLRVPSGSGT
ncbi:MAG: 2'-5' RNA ligase family protein [Myxococcota bacterium]